MEIYKTGNSPCSVTNRLLPFKLWTSKIHEDILCDLKQHSNNPSVYRNIKLLMEDLFSSSEQYLYSSLPIEVQQHPCLSRLYVEPIGSTSEGLALTELSEAGWNEEVDMTTVVKTMSASELPEYYTQENYVEIQYSQEFPGHVYLKINNSATVSSWNGLCNIVANLDGTVNDFYLSPVAVTDEFYLMMCYRYSVENLKYTAKCKDVDKLELHCEDSLNNSEHNPSPDILYDREVNENESRHTEDRQFFFITKQEGPAIKTTLLSSDNTSFQIDCCVAIPCAQWPSAADEFKNRIRRSDSFSSSLAEKLAKIDCLIVPKSPTTTKTNLEWRLSFCLVERELMLDLSENQRSCYLVAKAVWRKFLNPPMGKAVQSYHLKNILLWECENISKDEWTKELMVVRVTGIFQRLCRYLVEGYCPHFIIPYNNLFQDIEATVLFRSAQRVQTCIFQSSHVWVENKMLLYLPANQTRKAMGSVLHETCFLTIKHLIEGMVSKAADANDLNTLECPIDNVSHGILQSYLKGIVGLNIADFVLQYTISSSQISEDNIMRRYICSRACPRQLLVASKQGGLDGLASLVSTMAAWAEMIDFVTKMEILATENFSQYGFSREYQAIERLKLLIQYSYDILQSESDEEQMSTDENGKDENEEMYDEDEHETDEFICDACDLTIHGTRYHCTICEDFDLCAKCHEINITHRHEFLTLEKTNNSDNGTIEQWSPL